MAIRLMGARDNHVDDVVQETWMRATRRLSDFRWDCLFSTWVAGILINCCRERCSREIPIANIDVVPDNFTLPTTVSRIDLERALFSLPAGYRSVLVLHDIEGYTHEEIAELLGIDQGTSKSQLSRARRAMRARLTSTYSHHRATV